MKKLFVGLMFLGVTVTPWLKAQTILNSSFEAPEIASTNTYYSFQYNPTGVEWTFTGNAGIAVNGSGFAWLRAGTPFGSQFAFLQGANGIGGSMDQVVSNFSSGLLYGFSFWASQRDVIGSPYNNQSQNQKVTVFLDGTNLGSFTPPDTNWYQFTTSLIPVTPASHVLTFTNLPAPGDATVLIDEITVSHILPVPHPKIKSLILNFDGKGDDAISTASAGLNRAYAIETSANLISWTDVQTNLATSSNPTFIVHINFLDSQSPQMFVRLKDVTP